MLQFLGFVALVAIILGISLQDALTGVLKFIVLSFVALLAFGIVAKMLESKIGIWLVLIASILSLVLGVILINDDIGKRYSICFSLSNYSYPTCMTNAVDGHNSTVNTGWGLAIVGTITGLSAIGNFSDSNATNNKKSAKKY